MNYLNTFLFSLYATIQTYIFMGCGIYGYKRGFFSSKSIAVISQLLFVFLIPLYGILEVSRIATMAILNLFWILVVNFVSALIISYTLTYICHKIFKLDERIKFSYNIITAIPAMGALPLVIGKAFCFPNGPLEGDIHCDNMVGLQMMCYLIVCISVFLCCYVLILTDKIFNNNVQNKMIYLWHILIQKKFKKDETILYLFKKYLKDHKKSDELFEKFTNEHGNDLSNLNYDVLCKFDGHHILKKHSKHHNKKDSMKNPSMKNPSMKKNIHSNKKESFNVLMNKQIIESPIKKRSSFYKKSGILQEAAKSYNMKNPFSHNFEVFDKLEKSMDEIDLVHGNDAEANYNDSYFKDQSEISEEPNENSSTESKKNGEEEESSEDTIYNETFSKSSSSSSSSEKNKKINKNHKKRNNTLYIKHTNIHKDEQFIVLFENKESFYPGHNPKIKFDSNYKKISEEVFFSKSGKYIKFDYNMKVPKNGLKNKSKSFYLKGGEISKGIPSFKLQNNKSFKIKQNKSMKVKNSNNNNIHNFDIKNSEKETNNNLQTKENNQNNNNNTNTNDKYLETNDIFLEERKKEEKEVEINNLTDKQLILNYYNSAFDIIESDPDNFNLQLLNEYEEMKEEILSKIQQSPPQFPIVRSAKIDSNLIDVISKEWKDFELKLSSDNKSFKKNKEEKIDINILLGKCVSPPLLAVIIGFILSVSNVREIIFNTNHFWGNILDGLGVIDKVFAPFLILLMGISIASTNGLSMNSPLTKLHLIMTFVLRFFVIPGIGLLFIFIWKEVYGGVVKESTVFRIIMFFPWCLPCAPNISVIVNLTQYFFEEYGYIILLQNAACIVTLTVLYLIYFILIGL